MDYYEQMQTEAMTKGMAESSNKNLKDLLKLQADLRKLVEKWRNESTGSIYKVQTGYCADELEKLLGGE